MIAIQIGIYVMRSENHIVTIRNEARKQGAQNIQVRHRFWDYDKGSHTYCITFTDDNGEHYETTCKATSRTGELYWSRSPADAMFGVYQSKPTPTASISWEEENELVKQEIAKWRSN